MPDSRTRWRAVLDGTEARTIEEVASHAYVVGPNEDPGKPLYRMAFAVCGWANRTGTDIRPGAPFCPACEAIVGPGVEGWPEEPTDAREGIKALPGGPFGNAAYVAGMAGDPTKPMLARLQAESAGELGK